MDIYMSCLLRIQSSGFSTFLFLFFEDKEGADSFIGVFKLSLLLVHCQLIPRVLLL